MFNEEGSAFWFYGRLHPSSLVPPFQAEEVMVEEGVRLEVVWDGIGVWALAGGRRFKAPGEASELFGLVVAAYALLTRTRLTASNDGWVEALNAQIEGSVLGFQSQQMRSADEVSRDSEESIALRTACLTAIALRSRPNYRVAIRDIHSALGPIGSDAFLYAYRAVEAGARALTGALELAPSDWEAFHRRLGLEPEEGRAKLDPLRSARHAIAHGDEGDEAVGEAERRRQGLLDVARWFVIATIERDPSVDAPGLGRYLTVAQAAPDADV